MLIIKERQIYVLACRIGSIISLLIFPLDWIIYPDHKWSLLTIRIAISAYLFVASKLFQIVNDKYLLPITIVSCYFASLSVTLMCFISGEGFASPYYAGQFIVMIVVSALIEQPQF